MENEEELNWRKRLKALGIQADDEWHIPDIDYLYDFIEEEISLADKQGYLRGEKETLLRVVDDLYNVPPTGTVNAFDMINAIEQYRQKLDKEAQAHDAISKLKEV